MAHPRYVIMDRPVHAKKIPRNYIQDIRPTITKLAIFAHVLRPTCSTFIHTCKFKVQELCIVLHFRYCRMNSTLSRRKRQGGVCDGQAGRQPCSKMSKTRKSKCDLDEDGSDRPLKKNRSTNKAGKQEDISLLDLPSLPCSRLPSDGLCIVTLHKPETNKGKRKESSSSSS